MWSLEHGTLAEGGGRPALAAWPCGHRHSLRSQAPAKNPGAVKGGKGDCMPSRKTLNQVSPPRRHLLPPRPAGPSCITHSSLPGDNPWSQGCPRVREEDSFIFSWNCCHPEAPDGGRSRSLQASLAENRCNRVNRPRLRIRAQGHSMSSSSLTGVSRATFSLLCGPL